MPEVHDQYINTEVVLPRGDKKVGGQVIAYKCDATGNSAEPIKTPQFTQECLT